MPVDEEFVEDVQFGFSIEDTHQMYAVVEDGDGYYYGEPIAVFFDESVAHAWMKDNRGRDVIPVVAVDTDNDGWGFQSDYIKEENAVISILMRRADVDIVGLVEELGITPEDFGDHENDRIKRVCQKLAHSSSPVPDAWEDTVNEYLDEYFDG